MKKKELEIRKKELEKLISLYEEIIEIYAYQVANFFCWTAEKEGTEKRIAEKQRKINQISEQLF